MAYYRNGANVTTGIGAAQYTAAAVDARFKGMNVLTTLDALPITAGFDAYATTALTGYKWGGTQINYVTLSSLKRTLINRTLRSGSDNTFSNTLAHPRVYYVVFQAAGGAGGTDDASSTGCGGGSGNYTLSKVVLQPGASFKVTRSTTKATITLVTGAAYMNGAIRAAGYSFSITASAGSNGGPNSVGTGFRSGGQEEKNGGSITANSLSHDGYTYPPTAIGGGLSGDKRVSYSSTVEAGRGGGGGGASAAGFLRNTSETFRSGGGGAFYYKDTYHTYSLQAETGWAGGGGGGSEGPNPGKPGGVANAFIYY